MRVIEGGASGRGNGDGGDRELLVKSLRGRVAKMPRLALEELLVQLSGNDPNVGRLQMIGGSRGPGLDAMMIIGLIRGLDSGQDMSDFEPMIAGYTTG